MFSSKWGRKRKKNGIYEGGIKVGKINIFPEGIKVGKKGVQIQRF